jgi:hypothetical protein
VTPNPGDLVRLVLTKWGRRPHWEFDATYLGSDEAGDWIGIPAGTRMVRPGAEYVAPVHQVGLSPAPGPNLDRGWLATFHARGGEVHTYVDMTTPPYWTNLDLNAVDLDLDVVRGTTGEVWVEDQDEFARHQRELGYPAEIIALAESSAERIRAAMEGRRHPFDGTADTWLDLLVHQLRD